MIRLTNTRTGREIVFDGDHFFINAKDLGIARADHNTYKGLNQVGEYLAGSSINGRDISLTGYIMASGAEEMERQKRQLFRILNPLDPFDLVLGERKISCVAENTPKLSTKWYENDAFLCRFVIDAYCANPCFTPIEESRAVIASWMGAFRFPLVIPADSGIQMGIRSPSLIVTVDNPGDLETGMMIVFTAVGAVTNPYLLDLSTQKQIKLVHAMAAGETVQINTNYGQKGVVSVKDNITTDIFSALTLDSDFLQLAEGANTYRYGADSNPENLEIAIRFYPQYLGV